MPAADDGVAPQAAYAEITECREKHGANGTTQQERRANLIHLVQQEFPRQFEMERLGWGIHKPGPDFVGTVKQHGHGDRVADPNQTDRQWQVDAEENRDSGSHDHLAGEGNKRHKQTYRKRTGSRTAIQAPQIGVIKHIAKYLQRFLALDDIMTRHHSFNYLSRHRNSFMYRQA